MIFWKEAWLKRVPDEINPEKSHVTSLRGGSPQTRSDGKCSEKMVLAACTATQLGHADPTYICQATLLPNFTQPLSWRDIRQYIEDYQSGNVKSFRRMLPRFIYRTYVNLIDLGIGWGPILRWLYDLFQKFRGGIPYPARSGNIVVGSKTPMHTIDLQPGELVRVKSYEEILKTLDTATKNRGMAFSAEMVPYCGKIFRVRSRVTRIINEQTGKMLHLKNPCIILEGVTCQALYNKNMLFCPRATYPYWREIWLEQVTDSMPQQPEDKPQETE